jgi:hypothetical protein
VSGRRSTLPLPRASEVAERRYRDYAAVRVRRANLNAFPLCSHQVRHHPPAFFHRRGTIRLQSRRHRLGHERLCHFSLLAGRGLRRWSEPAETDQGDGRGPVRDMSGGGQEPRLNFESAFPLTGYLRQRDKRVLSWLLLGSSAALEIESGHENLLQAEDEGAGRSQIWREGCWVAAHACSSWPCEGSHCNDVLRAGVCLAASCGAVGRPIHGGVLADGWVVMFHVKHDRPFALTTDRWKLPVKFANTCHLRAEAQEIQRVRRCRSEWVACIR